MPPQADWAQLLIDAWQPDPPRTWPPVEHCPHCEHHYRTHVTMRAAELGIRERDLAWHVAWEPTRMRP